MVGPYSQEELIQSVDVLKITVPRMNSLSIPITPENYTVWYEYSQGTTLELNKVIDDHLNRGDPFTREISRKLYETYIVDQSPSALKAMQAATKSVIESLVKKIQSMSSGVVKFGGALDECKQLLQGEPDVNQLTEIVHSVLENTETVSSSNQEMMSDLASMEQEVVSMRSRMERLSETAYKDQLTRIANRWAFDKRLQSQFEALKTSNISFSLILIDIDHFKQFNDTYGHAIGDKVLIYVASSLKAGLGEKDLVARYGGEEFVVILPESDYDRSVSIANALREKISQRKLTSSEAKESIGNITISAGVSCATSRDDKKSLIERADQAMYLAKERGRNQVCGERNSPG